MLSPQIYILFELYVKENQMLPDDCWMTDHLLTKHSSSVCNRISVQIQVFRDFLRGLLRPYGKKTASLSPRDWQVRGKVVETLIAGLGYKKISQALNVLWSAVKSIVWK